MRALRQLGAVSWLPAALLAGAAALAAWGPADAQAVGEGALALALLGFLFAAWYRRGREALIFGLIAGSMAVISQALPPGAPSPHGAQGQLLYAALASLLPLNLAVLAHLPQRGLLTPAGFRRLAALALQAGAVAGVMAMTADWRPIAELLHLRLLPQAFDAWSYLPQPAIWIFAAAGLALAWRLARGRTARDAGLLAALAGLALGLHAIADPAAAALYHAAAAAALLAGLVHDGYRMAFIDELTGLANRRALSDLLRGVGGPYTLAMLDIDHFKKVNDSHGHEVGDQVLKMAAGCLAGVGGGGRAYRYGGEEFAIIFPGRSAEVARPHLECVRQAVEASGFRLRGGDRPRHKPKQPARGRGGGRVGVTISIGLAERTPDRRRADDVLAAADKALYQAKKAGRNRIVG